MVDLPVAAPFKRLKQESDADRVGPAGKLPPIVLKEVYEQRFSREDEVAKEAIWREVGRYLQRFVEPGARVVDIACDIGYFIRNIRAADRWATDIRDVASSLPKDVHFVRASGLDLADVLPNDHFDLAFFSNYLEHLSSTEAVLQQLKVAFSILKPGGRVLILQPNIRLIGGSYWDFIDHQTALTEKSLAEAAAMAGFTHKKVITRFLPYTTKSRFPQHPLLVRAYLGFPPAWLLLGKQTLYLGEKPRSA
ncbi:MAG: class I SAM-dependent methyltransferase [Chloroflexi bacterium]|nr:MAG: class I SAM-dependent methyltransferase [Chloroflexota bacterium]TMC71327.1 MAG: class I SAM-dependent methyltransferase [Chloroflexota bacterium]